MAVVHLPKSLENRSKATPLVGIPGRPCLRWTSRNVFFVTQRVKRKAAEAMRHLPAVTWCLPQQFCSALLEYYSHFSLVRTISGKEKILYYRELLVSEKFFKTRWIPLVLPSPVILNEDFFYHRELPVSEKFCITLVFPCGFTVSVESPVYFGQKVYLSFSSSFIGSRFV